MSEEFKDAGIAVNALWPQTGTHILPCEIPFEFWRDYLLLAIITAAMEMLAGKEAAKMCRKPEIMSDAGMFRLLRSKVQLCYI